MNSTSAMSVPQNSTADSNANASPLERELIAALFTVLCATSLAHYVVFFATVLYSKKLRSNPFFKMMFSLGVNDAACQLAFLIIGVPSTLIGAVYSDSANSIVSSVFIEIDWFHNTLMLVFQSFNRLLSICYQSKVGAVFGGRRIWLFIFSAWLVGIGIGLPTMFSCCRVLYFVDEYTFGYDFSLIGAIIISYVDLVYTTTLLTTVLVVHAVIFFDVYKRHHEVGANQSYQAQFQAVHRKHEVALFVQLFVIAAADMVTCLAFNVVPLLTASRFGGLFTSLVNIVSMSLNGVVFLYVNKTVGGEARKMLLALRKKLHWSKLAGGGAIKVSRTAYARQPETVL